MTRWYRAYEGTVTDPKLAEAAMVADCSRSVAVAAWHLTLENAAAINDGGRIDIPTRRIAAALCEPLAVIDTLIEAFTAIGLLTGSHVTTWNSRQYLSDSSTERSRRSRKNKKEAECNGDATLLQRCATPPETETEVPLADANGREPASLTAADVTKSMWDTGKAIFRAAGYDDRQAGSIIGRFRKNYSESQVLLALSRCQIEQPSEPLEWLTKALQYEANGNARSQQNRSRADDDEPRNSYVRAHLARQSARTGDGDRSTGGWP